MKYYLIEYDRETKKLLQAKEYSEDERKQAWDDRLNIEIKYFKKGINHIEAVVFGAKSLEDLKKTHSRYFYKYKPFPTKKIIFWGGITLTLLLLGSLFSNNKK